MTLCPDRLQQMQSKFCEELEKPVGKDIVELVSKAIALLEEELQEIRQALADYRNDPDSVKAMDDLVDGFCDAEFVSRNGVYKVLRSLGQTEEEAHTHTIKAMMSVAEANYSKLDADGKVTYDTQTGKVVKPFGWKAPSHYDIVTHLKNNSKTN